MLIIDIVSWVIVGLVIGAVWAFLASDEHIKLVGTLIFGVIGALVGGFVFVGEAVPGGKFLDFFEQGIKQPRGGQRGEFFNVRRQERLGIKVVRRVVDLV